MLGLVVLFILVLVVGLGLTGRSVQLPVWAVAEVEARMNRSIGNALEPGASVALGGAAMAVGPGGVPRLQFEDLRLINGAGRTIAMLPLLDIHVDPLRLLHGEIRLRSLRLAGAQATLRRPRRRRRRLHRPKDVRCG